MAFTFAHPAIVLPLYKKYNKHLDFTALVLGTMAPDFEYFIHFRPINIVGHTFLGQLYLNLPIALLLAYIYHYIVKEPIISNLPQPFCYRYRYLAEKKWEIHSLRSLLVFCGSMIFGALTHLAWDGFTHSTGYFVARAEWLSEMVGLAGIKILVYKVLQHGTTLIGLALILVFIIRLQKMDQGKSVCVNSGSRLRFWGGAAAVGICIVALRVILPGDMALGEAIVSSIDRSLIGLLVASIAFRNRNSVN
jgi:hypothetical protein